MERSKVTTLHTNVYSHLYTCAVRKEINLGIDNLWFQSKLAEVAVFTASLLERTCERCGELI